MKKLTEVKGMISKTAGRTGLVLKKYSPEILMVSGVVGVIGSTILACKATLKVEEILEDADRKFTMIKDCKEQRPEEYPEKDYKRDMTLAYVQTGAEFVKIYWPAATLGAISIGCLLGAHGIMKKRNIALMASYKALEQMYSDYRHRVVEELGEEKDRQYHLGLKPETISGVEIDENGKSKKVKKDVEIIDPNKYSMYARYFDESSLQWSKVPGYNMMFLKAQQNYANDLLRTRGHVFLNEVYDLLGIPRSQPGAVVGWVLGEGDDFIDFGIYNADSEEVRDFVNGYEQKILLDFNVDGIIYDLI